MKNKIDKFIEWFESKFNIIIDLLALIGGAFCIFLAALIFIIQLISGSTILQALEVIFIPGVIGFFGLIILFALRITRSITKK